MKNRTKAAIPMIFVSSALILNSCAITKVTKNNDLINKETLVESIIRKTGFKVSKYAIKDLILIAGIYEGTVKVHKTYYGWRAVGGLKEPSQETFDKVCADADANSDGEITLEEAHKLEAKEIAKQTGISEEKVLDRLGIEREIIEEMQRMEEERQELERERERWEIIENTK